MTEKLYQRATLLLQQKRYNEAAQAFNELIIKEPTNPQYLAHYAETLLELKQAEEALKVINQAISIAPDSDYLFYLQARVKLSQKKYDEAEEALRQAIQLDPSEADYYAILGNVRLNRKKYDEALSLANQALELQPDNINALNLRSSALVKLNKKEEAFNTIEGALKEDPNNSYTHANYGWGQLENGNPKKALAHFSEALKHDPNNMMAQAGMQQALKARYLPYRWFLKYAFWIGNLSAKYQWGIIIGFYLLARFIGNTADNNPELAPYLYPIMILYSLVAFSTWVIGPISSLFLLLNPYGRHLLSQRDIRSATLVGISVGVSLLALVIYLITKEIGWAALAAMAFTYMIPAATIFKPASNRWLLVAGSLLLLALGAYAVNISFLYELFVNRISVYYLYGLIGYQFLTNFLLIKEDNI